MTVNPRDLFSIVDGVKAILGREDLPDAQKVRLIQAIVELAELEAL